MLNASTYRNILVRVDHSVEWDSLPLPPDSVYHKVTILSKHYTL